MIAAYLALIERPGNLSIAPPIRPRHRSGTRPGPDAQQTARPRRDIVRRRAARLQHHLTIEEHRDATTD
jgi:hypothetical protein